MTNLYYKFSGSLFEKVWRDEPTTDWLAFSDRHGITNSVFGGNVGEWDLNITFKTEDDKIRFMMAYV